MKITFIQCGGTIDKDYPKRKGGYAFEIGEAAVKRIMKRLKPSFDYEIISAMKKDSLDMNEEDRKKLLEICRSLDNDKIIITHGTDTMLETARMLSNIKDKKIILTGAFLPERFYESDAPINIGVAIGAMHFIEDGIYIAMSGRVIPWEKCKRRKDGRFDYQEARDGEGT
ncbi:MAG: asparaginase [Thermoplasmata archaeon]|nr:asparaginase [Thermoplasmata archaeon]